MISGDIKRSQAEEIAHLSRRLDGLTDRVHDMDNVLVSLLHVVRFDADDPPPEQVASRQTIQKIEEEHKAKMQALTEEHEGRVADLNRVIRFEKGRVKALYGVAVDLDKALARHDPDTVRFWGSVKAWEHQLDLE